MNILNYALYPALCALVLLVANRPLVRSFLNSFRRFECRRCGHCCRLHVRLSDADIRRIEKGTKYRQEDFAEKNKKKNYIRRINGYCPFLSISKGRAGCTIYDHRPDICRTYPHFKRYRLKMSDSRCNAFDKRFK